MQATHAGSNAFCIHPSTKSYFVESGNILTFLNLYKNYPYVQEAEIVFTRFDLIVMYF